MFYSLRILFASLKLYLENLTVKYFACQRKIVEISQLGRFIITNYFVLKIQLLFI